MILTLRVWSWLPSAEPNRAKGGADPTDGLHPTAL